MRLYLDSCVLIYALDGVVVGYTQEDYDKALEEKYGRICTENIEKLRTQKPPFTNPKDAAYSIKECGPQEFWFYKGTDLGDGDEWRSTMCDDKKESLQDSGQLFADKISYCGDQTIYICDGEQKLTSQLYEQCLIENEAAQCSIERNKLAATKPDGGPYPHDANGRKEPPCGNAFWVCEGSRKDTEEDYKAACPEPACRPNPNPPWYCPYRPTRPECQPCL